MSQANVVALTPPFEAQPFDVQGLTPAQRDALIISALQIDGRWVIVSRYGEDRWKIVGQPTNKQSNECYADFDIVPEVYRTTMKEVLYRYIRRGREGKSAPPPAASSNYLRTLALSFNTCRASKLRDWLK